jgi:hypothetical protein
VDNSWIEDLEEISPEERFQAKKSPSRERLLFIFFQPPIARSNNQQKPSSEIETDTG